MDIYRLPRFSVSSNGGNNVLAIWPGQLLFTFRPRAFSGHRPEGEHPAHGDSWDTRSTVLNTIQNTTAKENRIRGIFMVKVRVIMEIH
jgi:hypothetical protein